MRRKITIAFGVIRFFRERLVNVLFVIRYPPYATANRLDRFDIDAKSLQRPRYECSCCQFMPQ
jgi:hypothetical protein